MFWGKFRACGVSKQFVLDAEIDQNFFSDGRISFKKYLKDNHVGKRIQIPEIAAHLNILFQIRFWECIKKSYQGDSDAVKFTVTGGDGGRIIISPLPEGFCAKALGFFGIKYGAEFYSSGMGVTSRNINDKDVYLPYANLAQKSVITCPFFIKGALWSFGLVFGQDRVVQFFEWLWGAKGSFTFPESESISKFKVKHTESLGAILESSIGKIFEANQFTIVEDEMLSSIMDSDFTLPVTAKASDEVPLAVDNDAASYAGSDAGSGAKELGDPQSAPGDTLAIGGAGHVG
ncbi:hypothetical protein Cyrtocomes_00736 [Candidatus Cyrtobacter comes]|uniref:Uncharacterized protein n=1 Tax=Candidatus Cyrtobacter comes TaxID=675776 RepID=A0ABU5L8A6_9RICK|nr:hypothetical protein [Candidatus Cyrtobacter comes]MDZ5762357.1 hypothetical protein [Candidatus Cyrtobacter comes]